MGKQTASAKSYDKQAVIDQARKDILKEKEPDDILTGLERGLCAEHDREVPAKKSALTLEKWQEWMENAPEAARRAWTKDAKDFAKWLYDAINETNSSDDPELDDLELDDPGLQDYIRNHPEEPVEQIITYLLVALNELILYIEDKISVDADGYFLPPESDGPTGPFLVLAMAAAKRKPSLSETIKIAWEAWVECENYEGRNPLGASVEAYVLRPPTIETASVSVVSDGKGKAIGSILPFVVSEFTRNTFSEIPIETATVDGVPVLTQITDAEESIRHALKERTRRLLISGQGGQASLEFPLERKLSENSFFGLLYGEFERRFGTVMARNMGYLAKIIYSANQPLIISEHEGGQLFARHKDGRYRTPKKSDIARFNDAALALRNFVFFINMETRSWRALASIESGKNGVYTLDKALWFDRKSYTLTGGLVFALKRNSRQNSHLPRIIEGIEYYLARAWRPKNKISELLLPERDNTGPGRWVEKGWRQFLALIGENMTNSEATLSRIFRRHKNVLASEGYIYRAGGEAQDTVEFRIGHGSISFRATDKGVEAAKQAWKQDWETKSLNELLGNPFDYQQK